MDFSQLCRVQIITLTTKLIKEDRGKGDGEILKTGLEVSKRQQLEEIYMRKNSAF